MAYNPSLDSGGPAEDTPPEQPAQPSGPAAPTYTYAYTDPSGTQVYTGSDGSLYTYANSGPYGFEYVPYSGPGQNRSGATPPAPPPGPGGGGGGAPSSNPAPAGGAPTFNPPTYNPPPAYTPPPPFQYDPFAAPSADEITNDPGHQFRLKTGTDAISRSATARGTLNTGGTLADILGYGQELGSQDYGDLWNRKFSTYQQNRGNAFENYKLNYGIGKDAYDTNLKGQYTDPYAFSYQGSSDRYNSLYNAYRLNADLYDADFNRRYKTLSLL